MHMYSADKDQNVQIYKRGIHRCIYHMIIETKETRQTHTSLELSHDKCKPLGNGRVPRVAAGSATFAMFVTACDVRRRTRGFGTVMVREITCRAMMWL